MIMNNITFYPMLTGEMIEASGLSVSSYAFSYEYGDSAFELLQQGKNTIKLSDPLEIWKVESEGLILEKTVSIAYPELLKGANGVACKDSELGLCIVWTNRKLTRTGIITPESDADTPNGRKIVFEYRFDKRSISGDLELKLILYIKKQAAIVYPGEESLMNEVGVTVGEIETIALDFSSLYMEFPIEEVKSDKDPLWWVDIGEWEDPKETDLFSRESFCLYLNTYYSACPLPSLSAENNTIRNVDLLIDILAQTYLLLFLHLTEDQRHATVHDLNLTPNSVCSVLHQFIESCTCELHLELIETQPQKVLKNLQINLREILLKGDE